MRFLRNEFFEEWQDRLVHSPVNLSEVCKGWHVELSNPNKDVTLKPADLEAGSGLSLSVEQPMSWIRLWQQVPSEPGKLNGRLRILLNAQQDQANPGLALEWMAVLQENKDGKRAFAKNLPVGTFKLTPTWGAFEYPFDPKWLAPGKRYYLALHFVGVGTVNLKSCRVDGIESLAIAPAIQRAAVTAALPATTETAKQRETPTHLLLRDAGKFVQNVNTDLQRLQSIVARLQSRLSTAETAASAAQTYIENLRVGIGARLAKLTNERPTPYYRHLRLIVENLADIAPLSQIDRTLTTIDMQSYGAIPRAAGPLVSIVMPAYNRKTVIGLAIDSALAQTHGNFELLICDDSSDDDTLSIAENLRDKRIKTFRHKERKGAAAARNTCLQSASGDYVAYLDTDNIWHPRFLEVMLAELAQSPGNVAAYASYFDVRITGTGAMSLKAAKVQRFHLEDQLQVPFVDLNSFIHRRELSKVFGGFDERLVRRQDFDLISRYCWIREPLHVPHVLNLYQRDDRLEQITRIEKNNSTAADLIAAKVDDYYKNGLPVTFPPWLKKLTVVSWDMSRNHFAKAYCVADALSKHLDVELISFRFFNEPIFEPLAQSSPNFDVKYFDGGDFPAFFDNFARALTSVTGDAIYAIKPRLSSMGLALMANYHTGKPIFLEANDLETVVGSPRSGDRHVELPLEAVLEGVEEAKVPHSMIWSKVLDPCVWDIPVVFTHNINLNVHYGRRCLYMRNIKDDRLFDPATINRDAVRAELGFAPDDRVILFGGLVRKHKGIFELVDLLEKLNDPRYKLLVVGSRETPDLLKLKTVTRDAIRILGPQPPDRMAALNLASDLVVLWLDPTVPASRYQSPYKMSDALAMGPAIVASPTSDLAEFAERGLMWTVPFGDFDALVKTVHEIFHDGAERQRRRDRARRFFLREFSYKSVAPSLALGAALIDKPNQVYPVSEKFAKVFSRFRQRLVG
jgi:glycosyltransferase involved in cell wall biosynthesis